MLQITTAIDHLERDRPWKPDGWRLADRYYLDDRGHAWRAVRYRTLRAWRRGTLTVAHEPGEFFELAGALRELSRLRSWYREPPQPRGTEERAHLARWRIVRVTGPPTSDPATGEGTESERYDLVELSPVPAGEEGASLSEREDLRAVSLEGWTLADRTQPARVGEEEGRAHAERWQHSIRREARYGGYNWLDRESFLRFVRPSKTTRTETAHYAERAGRWRRVTDPAEVWRQRDTVEVEVRLNDPRLSVAVYKRRGRVDSFQGRRACRVFHAYDTVLDSGAVHRAVRAPHQEAAALAMLMDRARFDLAAAVDGERRRRRRRAAQAAERRRGLSPATAPACTQLALFRVNGRE